MPPVLTAKRTRSLDPDGRSLNNFEVLLMMEKIFIIVFVFIFMVGEKNSVGLISGIEIQVLIALSVHLESLHIERKE